ncbi:MAG: SBBP repeat-containing protein, partial [Candidatus Heimdallarchaeota archaeon]
MPQKSFIQIVRRRGIILLILMLALPLTGFVLTQGQIAKIDNGVESNALYPTLDFTMMLGGTESENGFAIAIASFGSYYVTGATKSTDFPTLNAFDESYNGGYDVFVAKFSASGSLLWSTYLGGANYDFGNSLAVATDGSCYVVGTTHSENFPTKNAFDNSF